MLTQGKRVYPDAEGHLKLAEGEYGKNINGEWLCRAPGCRIGFLSEHTVIEHEDGTITVSPSLLYNHEPQGKLWHGYLERGVWREI